MRRRNVLIALAAVAAICMAMPAFGAPSPLSTAKRALSTAKKANRTAKSANRRARTARTAATTAASQAAQALALINAPGGVPRANSAATADSATNATTAGTANELSGLKRVGKLTRAEATPGPDEATARGNAPAQALGTAGPLTFTGKCFTDEGTPVVRAEIYVATTVDGVLVDGQVDDLDGSPEFLNAATPEDARQVEVQTEATDNSSTIDMDEDMSSFVLPDGTTFHVLTFVGAKRGTLAAGNGPFGDGNSCLIGLQIQPS